MNRRAFLTALGAVATQQKFRPVNFQQILIDEDNQPTVAVTRFPYVQNVRGTRASIVWGTIGSGAGQVRFTADGVNFRSVTATTRLFSRADTRLLTDYVQYQADLTGLTPGTDYSYNITVDGIDVGAAGEMRFRTAGPGPFSFVVLGDSGWGDPQNPAQGLIAQKIAADKPALVIHTGDLVYPQGSFEFYQRNYFNYYAGTMSSVPFFPCPGNHDYDVAGAVPYLAIHALPTEGVPTADRGRYYSFDWGNVHFVSIDSQQSLDRAVNANGPMLRWLDNDLRSTRQFWKIVYFHHPPFATGNNVNDIQSTWAREYLVPIFENNGVQIVFCGHEHSYQRIRPLRKSTFVAPGLGTNYVVSGGGGAVLYPVPDKPMLALARSAYHYLRADVQGTHITLRSIRQDGTELDSYTISPTPAFSDDARITPVSMSPGLVAGATIRINGRGLAGEEAFNCTPTPPTELAGIVVTVNGIPIELLYVSPNQIYGRLPVAVEGNITVRVTRGDQFVERSL